MDHPKIVKIELTPAHVPFRSVVRDAMSTSEGGLGMAIAAEEEWLGGDFVICKLRAEDGSVGLGEAFVWLPETGISPHQIIDVIQNPLGRFRKTHQEGPESLKNEPDFAVNGMSSSVFSAGFRWCLAAFGVSKTRILSKRLQLLEIPAPAPYEWCC